MATSFNIEQAVEKHVATIASAGSLLPDDAKELWQAQQAKPATTDGEGGCPTMRSKKGRMRLSIAYPSEQDAERAASDKSSGYLATILRNEYTGLSLIIILLAALLSLTDRALSSVTAMTGYIILLLSLLAKISTAIYKIALIKQVDLATDSIADFALKMDRFHLFVTRERLIGLSSIPFGLVSLYLFFDGLSIPSID